MAYNNKGTEGRGKKLQNIIYKTIEVILNKYPIPKSEVERMCDNQYTKDKDNLDFKLGNRPLLRKESEGRDISGHSRYKKDFYGNYPERYHVSTEWFPLYHKHNAHSWIKYLERLIDSDTNQHERNNELSSLIQEYRDFIRDTHN